MHFELPPESATARNVSNSVKTTRRPPTNMNEKRTARQQQRNENYANKYLRDLRRAFDQSDEDDLGSLTPSQWMNSSIRYYIREGKLTTDEFEKYFLRIDANCDGRVSWEELVEYILLELTSMTSAQIVDSPMTLNRSQVTSQVFQNKHRESIFQVIVSSWTDEYITVSREAIKFWNPYPLSYKRKLPSKGPFSSICCFKNFQLLGVTTLTRTLCFYNIFNLDQLPIGLSASPSSKTIKSMKFENALQTMKQLTHSTIPLFNSPTKMIEATLTPINGDEIKLIIGDDCGYIELYRIIMPQRRTGTDYQIDRIVNYELHHSAVTQLSAIEDQNCYASSSQDGTVKFFNFLRETVQVTKKFGAGSHVTSFQFFPQQHVIALCTNGNEPFIWSIQPVRRAFRLACNFNSCPLVTNFVSSLGDRYVVTVTSKKEIRMFDSTNFGLRNELIELENLPPENKITSVLFDSARRILVTCCGFPIVWLEGEAEGPRGITHQCPIVGVHYQADFDQLLSVDEQANFVAWDYKTGKRKQMRAPHIDELSYTSIDQTGRRLIVSTFTGQVAIYNPSSGAIITTLDTSQADTATNANTNTNAKLNSKHSSSINPKLEPKASSGLNAKLSSKLSSTLNPRLEPKASSGLNGKLSSTLNPRLEPKTSSGLNAKFESKMSSSLNSNLISFDNSVQDDRDASGSTDQVSIMKHFTMNGRGFLMTASYSHVVSLYSEFVPSEFEFISSFSGHTSDITAAVLDSHSGSIITGSENGEIFSWPIDISQKPRRIDLYDNSPVECMTIVAHFLFICDSDGVLTVFTVPGLEEICQLKAHPFVVPYALSSITSSEVAKTIVTGDNLGYIRLWKVNLMPSFSLQPLGMVRAHDGEVTNLSMIGNCGKFFASAGYDMAVRVWESDTLRLVGTLTSESAWDIRDVSSWSVDSPVEGDPKHFELFDEESSGRFPRLTSATSFQSMSNIVTARSQTNLPSAVGFWTSRNRQKKEELGKKIVESENKEEKSTEIKFDLEKAKRIFESIQNDDVGYGNKNESFFERFERVEEKKEREIVGCLQEEADVNDMLTKVKELQKKKFKTIDEYFPEMKEKKIQLYPSLTFA